MTLDFKALRAKLNSLQGQNFRSNALWKPQAGENLIRLVPWKENKNNPFIELYFHYINGRSYLSPQTYGNRDPFVDFANKLMESNDKEEWKEARNYKPKLRTYAPIIERGKESEGVKFWGFGKLVYTELLALIDDEDYGDIVDPQTGRDIAVTFTPLKKGEQGFAKTAIRVKPRQTPLTTDAKVLKNLLENQPDIKQLFTEPTYDELKNILEAYLTPGSVTQQLKAPATTETALEFPPKEEAPVNQPSSAVNEIAEKFDELFGESK